jgi:hypothetical protein
MLARHLSVLADDVDEGLAHAVAHRLGAAHIHIAAGS